MTPCKQILAVAIVAMSVVTCATSAAAQAEQAVYVTVRKTSVRGKPLHWAPGIAQVSYGDKLTVQSASEGGWLSVRNAKGAKGFVHESAITDREVILTASNKVPVNVDNSDVVLAGKGFNKKVEEAYARTNSGANYTAVNSMEAVQVSQSELATFVKAGKLEAVS